MLPLLVWLLLSELRESVLYFLSSGVRTGLPHPPGIYLSSGCLAQRALSPLVHLPSPTMLFEVGSLIGLELTNSAKADWFVSPRDAPDFTFPALGLLMHARLGH